MVGAAIVAMADVVDFQEAGAFAAGGLALVMVAGQYFAADGRAYSGLVALTRPADDCVAPQPVCLGLADLAFAIVGLDRHHTGGCLFVDMDHD